MLEKSKIHKKSRKEGFSATFTFDSKMKPKGVLFDMGGKNPEDQERDETLIAMIDQINRSFGKGTMTFGSQGVEQKWRGASEHCSPNYTLNFAELPVVKAK